MALTSDDAKQAFKQFVKDCRKRSGKNQPEFAEAVGVHKQTVSQWERGVIQPGADNLELIASAGRLRLGECLQVPIAPASERRERLLIKFFREMPDRQRKQLLALARSFAAVRPQSENEGR